MWIAMTCAAMTAGPVSTATSRVLDCLPRRELRDSGGCPVAVSNDVMLVAGGEDPEGPPGQRVRAYMLRDGSWVPDGALPIAGQPSVQMGSAIDVDGDCAIVGGIADRDRPEFAGQAGIYRRVDGVWLLERLLEGERTKTYGWAVAVAGDRAFIATPHGERAGVDIYARGRGGWVLDTRLERPPDAPGFGFVIDADERILAVSASAGNRVYVYERAEDSWKCTAVLSDPASEPNDRFGAAVAVGNGRIVVGAPQSESRDGCGRATVFVRQGDEEGGWRLEARLTAPDAAPRDWFGASVAISGHRIAVGAYGDDGPNGPTGMGSGSVYLFDLRPDGWVCAGRVVAAEPAQTTSFGNRVALTREWLVATSPETLMGESGKPRRVEPGCVFVHPLARQRGDRE